MIGCIYLRAFLFLEGGALSLSFFLSFLYLPTDNMCCLLAQVLPKLRLARPCASVALQTDAAAGGPLRQHVGARTRGRRQGAVWPHSHRAVPAVLHKAPGVPRSCEGKHVLLHQVTAHDVSLQTQLR